jgi:hypothetical protein
LSPLSKLPPRKTVGSENDDPKPGVIGENDDADEDENEDESGLRYECSEEEDGNEVEKGDDDEYTAPSEDGAADDALLTCFNADWIDCADVYATAWFKGLSRIVRA